MLDGKVSSGQAREKLQATTGLKFEHGTFCKKVTSSTAIKQQCSDSILERHATFQALATRSLKCS